MNGRALGGALWAVFALGGEPAAAQDSYQLLKLKGQVVKWGPAKLGTAGTATYGFAADVRHFPDARNCRGMAPPDALLARSGISRKQLVAETRAAFETWSTVAGIRFREASPGTDPDILIGAQLKPRGRAFANVELGDERPTGRPAVGVEAALSPHRPALRVGWPRANRRSKNLGVRAIKQAMVCLNSDQAWKVGFDGDLESYDLRYTLIHEIGHAIGLDHAGGRGQIMSFRYQEDISGLQSGDIEGAIRIYGPAR